jgi:hypothetical protein
MKKIINGKKYDTETAEMLTVVEKIHGTHTLYKKKSGEFFELFFYKASGLGIEWTINQGELQYRYVDFLSVDAYEKIFGEVPE